MSEPPRIVFAGTPEFARASLQSLVESGYEVIAVYTQPDRPAGRGRKLTASPVKEYALSKNIPVYQPVSLKGEDEQSVLRELGCELMVVAAYGLILPQAVLDIPKYGCINVHASLLPRWRGAAPIHRAILAGDTETGITIMQMEAGLDTGPMWSKQTCPIRQDDSSETLHDKLAEMGGGLLCETIPVILRGESEPQSQDESQANYASKLLKEEGEIDWTQTATQIHRQIRAFRPWPVAQSHWNGKVIRIWNAEPVDSDSDAAPGWVVSQSKSGILVQTGKGMLNISELQLAGKKPMSAKDFNNAYKLEQQHFGNE
ncbi:MAG: methionyl-tRNA formyltransferase [Gammaproteobacteria bacterium]|nr:methionyl-tRNA formyltransferase [Gammaproteobacteria bacterium]MDH5694074.1 methionyl-tRNA formyltransferase [Gammaproteobacteria bacterium]